MIFAAPHGRAASVRPTERFAPDVVEIPQLHRSAPQQVLEQDLHAHQDEDHAADQLGLGLIFCAEGAADLDAEGLKSVMDSNLEALNKKIPAYSQVSSYELRYEPFAKTPKGSIKRFMYD